MIHFSFEGIIEYLLQEVEDLITIKQKGKVGRVANPSFDKFIPILEKQKSIKNTRKRTKS